MYITYANHEYTLREMTIDDYEAVFALWSRTPGMGLSAADSRTAIARYLARNPDGSFVCEVVFIEDEDTGLSRRQIGDDRVTA